MKKLLFLIVILSSCTNKHEQLIGEYVKKNYSTSYVPISFELDSIIDITDSTLIKKRNELYKQITFNTFLMNTILSDIDEYIEFNDNVHPDLSNKYKDLDILLKTQNRSLDGLNSIINKLPKTLVGWKVNHIFKMNNIEYQHTFIIDKEKTKIIEYGYSR